MTVSSDSRKDGPGRCPVCDHETSSKPASPAGDAPCSNCGHLLWFRMQPVDDAVILNLFVDMDPERAEIERVGEWLINSRAALHIIVNFHKVEYVSSTFVNGLIVLYKKVQGAGGKVVFCGMNQVIREIIRINRLDQIFDLSDDTDEALESF
ncbi:MAG: STAS domain-containing protein [Planctomycetes bacterium]|nr:STAS domain-containing protein [Planctomycetota bacterium]MBL7042483.1 STAS domain-containing protein [Pirellulaceae bacterium]